MRRNRRRHLLWCSVYARWWMVALSRWWSIGPLLAIAVLAATLNWKTFRRRYIYAAGILFNLAVSLWWLVVSPLSTFIGDFLLTNVTAASLAGIVWLCLELRSRRLRQTESASVRVFIPPLRRDSFA